MSFRYKQLSSDALNTFLFLNKHEAKVYDFFFSKHVALYLLQSLITLLFLLLYKTKLLFKIFDILHSIVVFLFCIAFP